jgi:hypothetical protein
MRRPDRRAVTAVIRTEICVCDGRVVLLITAPDETAVVIEMSPDQCREFVNGLGEAILRLSKIGVMA